MSIFEKWFGRKDTLTPITRVRELMGGFNRLAPLPKARCALDTLRTTAEPCKPCGQGIN